MATADDAKTDRARILNYNRAAELLTQWASAEDSYDDRTWPAVAAELKDVSTQCRDEDATGS